MDNELLNRIDAYIDSNHEALANDIIHFVNIKSVREEAQPGAPFGPGPRKMLDEVMKIAEERGFFTKDYGCGVIRVSYDEAEPELGIWTHGDVVPEGDGWRFEPYNAVEYKGCIVGRGATDNKGQLCAVLHLLTIFRELNVKLKYQPALYVGSCEETGMQDLIGMPGNSDAPGFINICQAPKISLVPDASFPVGYGGKGSARFEMTSNHPLHGVSFEAGHTDSPGKAVAVLTGKNACEVPDIPGIDIVRGEKTILSVETPPGHSAHPDPNGNMITRMSEVLIDNSLCAEEDVPILDFIRRVSLDTQGKLLGIYKEHPDMTPTTVACLELTMVNGKPKLHLNVRFPEGQTFENIAHNISQVCESNGFTLTLSCKGINPYLLDKNWSVLQGVAEIANSITGDSKKPYTLGGGTYAHILPCGLACGMDGNKTPEDFPKGIGGAHGKDECVSIERLHRAMKIYARILLYLNEQEREWCK